jgi:hypothetical protein
MSADVALYQMEGGMSRWNIQREWL